MNENNLNNLENNNVVNDNTATRIPIPDPVAQATVPGEESNLGGGIVTPTPVVSETPIVQSTPIQPITPTPITSDAVQPAAPMPQANVVENAVAPQVELSNVEPTKKKKMNPLILVLVFILILGGGTAVWYFTSMDKIKKNPPVVSTTTTSTTTTTKALTGKDKFINDLENDLSDVEKKYKVTRKVTVEQNENLKVIIDYYFNNTKLDFTSTYESIGGWADKEFDVDLNWFNDLLNQKQKNPLLITETNKDGYLLLQVWSGNSESDDYYRSYIVDKQLKELYDIKNVGGNNVTDGSNNVVLKNSCEVKDGEIHYADYAGEGICNRFSEFKIIIGDDGSFTSEKVLDYDESYFVTVQTC